MRNIPVTIFFSTADADMDPNIFKGKPVWGQGCELQSIENNSYQQRLGYKSTKPKDVNENFQVDLCPPQMISVLGLPCCPSSHTSQPSKALFFLKKDFLLAAWQGCWHTRFL